MKKFSLSTTMVLAAFMIAGCGGAKAKSASVSSTATAPVIQEMTVNDEISKDAKIQVAILLDTSGSMDGLIEQAKSRLWNIVNTLTTLKFKGKTPRIEIALYEYGNDRIPSSQNYIRQVTPLTQDLDLISEKLFALRTDGGQEYCGAVIDKAVKSLKWGDGKADMKLVYIAGNEPFTQGPINYKEAISNALANDIYVNTIHCGDGGWGGLDSWRDGAKRGKGKFFNIDHNARVRYYQTPFDDAISECNMKLNDTYISYSKVGVVQKENQMKQDANAKSVSSANYAERAVSKTKHAYTNSSWDLVDKISTDPNALKEIKKSELAEELQNKTEDEIKTLVVEKKQERENIQKEIADLAQKRQAYIDVQMKKDQNNTSDDLGEAINQSVLDLAMLKGYEQE
ncbi:VWA domain-containing protein [Bacteroides sp. 51]|uniref:vWA domain-containing protein n=1 Tax=Bacteroides sp. 51 TaxID=2302938 RepID=UPI0013D35883|nr:vWA domain-containing protein [Bacteroides sp. 51]NDV82796.1 VWA domain-containing protein [Bacteroides sp. 51]